MTNRLVEIETLYGALTVPDWPDDLIVRSLRDLGEWCAAETLLAAFLIESGMMLWDVGAFLGTFTLGAALHSRPAGAVLIEANRDLAAALDLNIQLLRCPGKRVTAGIGARSGWLVPLSETAENHGATVWSRIDAEPADGRGVPCHTLADLRSLYGDYDIIKLDLEGMELEALRGDLDRLKARRPVIWCECNEGSDSIHLLGALKWLGYDVLYLAFPAFRRANQRGATDLIYPMAYEAALVAAPAARLADLAARSSDLVPGEDIISRPVETAFDLRHALYDTPRWSKKDWVTMSRAELIGQLCRVTSNSPFASFLAKKQTRP